MWYSLVMQRCFVLLFLSACGPSAGGDGGPSSSSGASTSVDGGTTDDGATGAVVASTSDSSGSEGSTGGSSDSSSGSDSSSSGSSGSSSSGVLDSSSGDPTCVLVPFLGSERCECDGMPVNPALCGCLFAPDGCECDGVLHLDVLTCAWPCEGTTMCTCGNFPAPIGWCSS